MPKKTKTIKVLELRREIEHFADSAEVWISIGEKNYSIDAVITGSGRVYLESNQKLELMQTPSNKQQPRCAARQRAINLQENKTMNLQEITENYENYKKEIEKTVAQFQNTNVKRNVSAEISNAQTVQKMPYSEYAPIRDLAIEIDEQAHKNIGEQADLFLNAFVRKNPDWTLDKVIDTDDKYSFLVRQKTPQELRHEGWHNSEDV